MTRATRSRWAAVGAALLVTAGCGHIQSHLDPDGPRFAGAAADAPPDPEPALRVVTFNVEFAEHVDRAIEELTGEPALRTADVVLMQEMNVPGIRAVAAALRFHYVYYPATQRGSGGFGNAVLSRWPIVEDHKLVLPHPSPANGERRVAVRTDRRRVTGFPFGSNPVPACIQKDPGPEWNFGVSERSPSVCWRPMIDADLTRLRP